MRVAILVNAKAGKADRAACEERVKEIRDACAKEGIAPEIFLCSPARLTRTARQLASRPFDAVVAAGGDGTVSAVANGLAGTAMPLAVIPMGTLNHFAKDIDMPLELADAVRAIRDGETVPIDVGEVNGRVFVNNSSIGLYPEAVMERDDTRKRRGWSKLSAMLLAIARVVIRFPLIAVCIQTPERTITTKTPFVFVGNNAYSTSLLSLGKRDCLDNGALCIHTARTRGRLATLWATMRTIIRGARQVRDFETEHVVEASVLSKKRHLAVALDGEIMRLAPPLYYRIRPGALLVRRAKAQETPELRAVEGGAR
jgi:diacylglycerol kinase family enzyme